MVNIKITRLTCKRCGHTWTPRIADVRICPACKSYKWDTPKSEKGVLLQKSYDN